MPCYYTNLNPYHARDMARERGEKLMYNFMRDPDNIFHTSTHSYTTPFSELKFILRKSRPWFDRQVNLFELHPVIQQVLNHEVHKRYLTDWREMLLEYPHVPESSLDTRQVAYTTDNNKGERDIATTTSLGKFIKRHAPTMPDHVLRDIVALGGCDKFEFVHTIDEIVEVMEETLATSCMTGTDDWDSDDHPYNVYHPDYGWHMAVRYDQHGESVGRALCLNGEDGLKTFVRTYRYKPGCGTTTDEAMQAWLKSQGYTHSPAWPAGTKLRKILNQDKIVAPYIDGDNHYVNDAGRYLTIQRHGDHECRGTDGFAEDQDDDRRQCDNCGDFENEDDGCWVGTREDEWVCAGCADNCYVYAYGRLGRQYYVHSDNTVRCESDDEYYHIDYLDDNNIVWCEDESEYWRTGDCVLLASDDWVHQDNTSIVELGDNSGRWAWNTDCWCCAVTGLWFLRTDIIPFYRGEFALDPVETDAGEIHPDYYVALPENYFAGYEHHFVPFAELLV